MFDMAPERAETWLAELILDRLGSRTLLVVVENLDAVFEGLGTSGQQRLRAFIQEHPVVSLAATAQRLKDDIIKRTSPFFGFFQTEQLKPLSVEEATELLGKVAALRGEDDAAAFLQTATGASRVRALHHLSGGNHRVYIVLSQFITRDSIDALVDPFAKMVDEITPYYQERIRWLPPQQRKIVEHLCTRQRPTPVKALARHLFASHQTISAQLKDLRGKGYVLASQRGRESLYEIAEPLMRICVQVKENQSYGPLGLLVDFLRVWYDGPQLTERLEGCEPGDIARAYLESAIEKNRTDGNLRARLLVESLGRELADEGSIADSADAWISVIQGFAPHSEALALAASEMARRRYDSALRIFQEICSDADQGTVIANLSRFMSGALHTKIGKPEAAIEELDRSIDEFPENASTAGLRAAGLRFRGDAYGRLEKPEEQIRDYSAVITMDDVPNAELAEALLSRAAAREKLGDHSAAIADFSKSLTVPRISAGQSEQAHFGRANALLRKNEIDGAIQDFDRVLASDSDRTARRTLALLLRGVAHSQRSDIDQAKNDFNEVLKIADSPASMRASARTWLATINVATGQWNDALAVLQDKGADYSADLASVPLEFLIAALHSAREAFETLLERSRDLIRVFGNQDAVPSLGDALVRHLRFLASQSNAGNDTDTLENWAGAWEAAADEVPELALPVRLLRAGIDFLKSGKEDRGVLLQLNQEERRIVEQALGLEPEPTV